MALRPDAHFRGLVETQLKHAGISEPPVSVEDVAATLGVPVMTVRFPSWFTGAVVLVDGMPVILVNSACSPEGRRSALAHTLSHIIIRIDDPSTPYPRQSPDGHRSADIMAQEFVMPGFMVREQAAKWFNDHRYLARLFGVTEGAMMSKMREMGLVKGGGIVWDY